MSNAMDAPNAIINRNDATTLEVSFSRQIVRFRFRWTSTSTVAAHHLKPQDLLRPPPWVKESNSHEDIKATAQ